MEGEGGGAADGAVAEDLEDSLEVFYQMRCMEVHSGKSLFGHGIEEMQVYI